jgi:hypothetical protein
VDLPAPSTLRLQEQKRVAAPTSLYDCFRDCQGAMRVTLRRLAKRKKAGLARVSAAVDGVHESHVIIWQSQHYPEASGE